MIDYVKMMIDLYAPAGEETEELEGQGMVEYGLILVLVAVAAVVAMGLLGDEIVAVFEDVTGDLADR
jgi:pilus assembly protein Flp/PilA